MDDAQAGERLTRLWVEHRDAVAAFVYRRATNELVDDVVAETFLVAWCRLQDVPPDARAWLLAVARNVLSTQLRAHGRRKALEVTAALQPVEPSASAEDIAVDTVYLIQAWLRLSDAEREVLALAAWDRLTSKQAARVLNCSRSAFSVRLARARRHLLSLTQDQPSGAEERRVDAPAIPARRSSL